MGVIWMSTKFCKTEVKHTAYTYMIGANVCLYTESICDVDLKIGYGDKYEYYNESLLNVKETLSVGYNEVSWTDCLDASDIRGDTLFVEVILNNSGPVKIVGVGTRIILVAMAAPGFKYLPEKESCLDITMKLLINKEDNTTEE